MTIEQALADIAERVTTLRMEGHPVQAESIERAVDEIREHLAEFLELLSERDAGEYTGRSVAYLRSRFPQWEARGLATWQGRTRWYRRCVLVHHGNVTAAREAGRQAGRAAA